MIDTESIKQSVEILALIEADNHEQTGNERTWCPLCQPGGSQYHNSPALQVYKTQSFHCFGCGAGGDAISYVMLRDDVDFLEACKRLGWQGEGITKTKLDEIRTENERRQAAFAAERAEELDRKLAEYSTGEIWAAFQRRMQAEQRAWWTAQGIPQDWQDYLRLGYVEDKIYKDKTGELRHSPAYTIPYFHDGFAFRSLQYRLAGEGIADRYRFEFGLQSTYYMVTPSEQLYNQVVICEGAKKAIVAHIFSDFSKTTFMAVPSKTDWGGIAEQVKDCDAVAIVLDPDAWTKPKNASAKWVPAPIGLARQIGPAARIVDLPGKIDDLFLEGSLDRIGFLRLCMQGRKVQ